MHQILIRLAPFILTAVLSAAVVGTNPPALPLTAARINALPAAEQPAWHQYLAKSRALRAIDQAFLATELKQAGLKEATVPADAGRGRAMPLNEKPAWYAGDEARRRASNVVTFQTPAGGWSKNFNPADHPRAPGEGFSHDNTSRFLAPGDNDTPADLREAASLGQTVTVTRDGQQVDYAFAGQTVSVVLDLEPGLSTRLEVSG